MRLSWEREQKVPVMCFRGILRDPPSEITGVTEGTGFGATVQWHIYEKEQRCGIA